MKQPHFFCVKKCFKKADIKVSPPIILIGVAAVNIPKMEPANPCSSDWGISATVARRPTKGLIKMIMATTNPIIMRGASIIT
jgi:hypothetical protein